MAIDRVKVRARVTIGSLVVETGNGHADVLNFNVTKSRRTLSSFSASLKVASGAITGNLIGSNVKIEAGEGSPNKTIFVGAIRSAKISPSFDDPYYVLLSISGTDALSYLQGKKYTRRCRATKSSWVAITSVVRKTLKSGKFEYRKQEAFDITSGPLPTTALDVRHRTPTFETVSGLTTSAISKSNTDGVNLDTENAATTQ